MKDMSEASQTFKGTVYEEIGKYYLQYIIIESKDYTASSEEVKRVYSLLLVKSGEVDDTESVFVYDVARSYNRAYEILSVLKNNTVTPCTVTEVLDDIL